MVELFDRHGRSVVLNSELLQPRSQSGILAWLLTKLSRTLMTSDCKSDGSGEGC